MKPLDAEGPADDIIASVLQIKPGRSERAIIANILSTGFDRHQCCQRADNGQCSGYDICLFEHGIKLYPK
jgi:hypothetical protein